MFTWNARESGQLIDCENLQHLLNKIAIEGVFQKEKKDKIGRFELKWLCIAKRSLLRILTSLGCVKNLTFEPERIDNSTTYCTKLETKVDGPCFVGTSSYR